MTKSFPIEDLVVWSVGHLVFDNYINHRTTDIRHLTSCEGNFFTAHRPPLQFWFSQSPIAAELRGKPRHDQDRNDRPDAPGSNREDWSKEVCNQAGFKSAKLIR